MGPGSGPESPMSRHPVLSRLPGSGLSASVARALPLRGFLAGGAASRNGCIGTTAPPVPATRAHRSDGAPLGWWARR
eukprot:1611696-Prymnesium_polylepis.1